MINLDHRYLLLDNTRRSRGNEKTDSDSHRSVLICGVSFSQLGHLVRPPTDTPAAAEEPARSRCSQATGLLGQLEAVAAPGC